MSCTPPIVEDEGAFGSEDPGEMSRGSTPMRSRSLDYKSMLMLQDFGISWDFCEVKN